MFLYYMMNYSQVQTNWLGEMKGKSVRILDLFSAEGAKLNGKVGILSEFLASTGRWRVH